MNNIYYERKTVDDVGLKIKDVFSRDMPEIIGVFKMWSQAIDGFKLCENDDLFFTCISGNIRIVLLEEIDGVNKFSQFFLNDMDGKVIKIERNSRFALHNIDEGKSIYLMGYSTDDVFFKYETKGIFDWKRKMP